jgi:hypothetical protein
LPSATDGSAIALSNYSGQRVLLIHFSAARKEDGTLEAARVNVGRDGITPPM